MLPTRSVSHNETSKGAKIPKADLMNPASSSSDGRLPGNRARPVHTPFQSLFGSQACNMAIPVADALCDWVRPGHSCCRHDHTRNCVNKSAARDEKVNALLVSAGGGTCAAQKRTGGGREGAKNGMLLCASTGISCLHIVTESGHVGAAFCDPKVAHGHIVYAAPHVLDRCVPR